MATPIFQQGAHPDPAAPDFVAPTPETWDKTRRDCFYSPEMGAFNDCLRLPDNPDIRESIINDLSSYYALPPHECVRRCIHWEALSTEEWHAKPRNSESEIIDFYHTTTSWSFDLLWYAYLQSQGVHFPIQVNVARSVHRHLPGRRHLDFGSGVGVTSQLFHALGYRSDLADVSTTLLAFARYRLERRGMTARYIDLNRDQLPEQAYDVITAFDTLAHVPNLSEVASGLRRALAPGGVLLANLDVRPASPQNAWHLYDNDLPLRYILHRAGFEPMKEIDCGLPAYRAVSPIGIQHALRGARDTILLRGPLRPTVRRCRELMRRITP